MERRERFKKNLNGLYVQKYEALCERLPEEWQPFSGIRSFSAQDRLYAQGRTMPGPKCFCPRGQAGCEKHPYGGTVTHAKAGESAHNYGCGSDWTRFAADGEPIWLRADDPKWKEDPEWRIYLDLVAELGLRSGTEFNDPMHNELMLAVSWTTIATIWRDKGVAAANMSIMAAMMSLKKEDDDDVVL